MKPLRTFLDRVHPQFAEGGRFHKLYPLYEAFDTFLYTPPDTTEGPTHIRDGLDLKRMMATVVFALIPCIFMAMYNTGYQSNLAIEAGADPEVGAWRAFVMDALGLGFDPSGFLSNFVLGALYFVPVFLVCNIVGGGFEVLFSIIRRHEINEGFLVTGMLYPLILPPDIPLWQVAVGIIFGVVIGKEVFGGTGKNFLNPALTARAFLYFAYPAFMSGDRVWVGVDGVTAATPLTELPTADVSSWSAYVSSLDITWWDAFWGWIPGSMGETSTFCCLIGAAILIATGIGSWRIMAACTIGMVGMSALLWGIAGEAAKTTFLMPPHWHLVVGGVAFGIVFMATDPVSAAMTNLGRWVYGILIGIMTVVIRVMNPGYTEGIMLAILLGNVFAPLIDYCVIQLKVKRRAARYAT